MNRLTLSVALAIGVVTSCGPDSARAPDGIWLTEIGSGPITMIVLHGGPGLTHRYLRPEWDTFAAEARVVYYDQRGCGWSERTDSVSWERHVADLDSIVTSAEDAGPVVLAGSSWGSILALLYAYAHPGRATALVLSGVPHLRGSFLPYRRGLLSSHLLDTMRASIRSRGGSEAAAPGGGRLTIANHGDSVVLYLADSTTVIRKAMVAEARSVPIPVQDSAEVAADTFVILPELAARMGMACPSVASAVRRSLTTAPHLDSLASIRTPVLIVRGEEITVVGDGSQELAESLPSARIKTVTGAGHDPWFEQPDKFLEVVRRFMNECDAGRCGT